MAIWISRKNAAEARLKYRRGVTPPDEVRAMQVQYRNDQAEQRTELDGLEKKNVKPVEKKTPVNKPVKKVKEVKPKSEDKPDFGEHGKDFDVFTDSLERN